MKFIKLSILLNLSLGFTSTLGRHLQSDGVNFYVQSSEYDVKVTNQVKSKDNEELEVELMFDEVSLLDEALEFLRLSIINSNEDKVINSTDLKTYEKLVLDLADEMKPFSGLTQNGFETRQFLTSKRYYQFGQGEEPIALTPIEAQWRKIHQKQTYFDVTEDLKKGFSIEPSIKTIKEKTRIPSEPRYMDLTNHLFRSLDEQKMRFFLTKLTSFYTRYYRSKSGVDSSNFIYKTLNEIVKANEATHITVDYFHHSWPQSSIVARFEGVNKKDEIIIVGAHQDSVNQWLPWFGRAPGADDDGSGTTSTVDAFRALVEGKFRPNRTLEFHWYSGEEAGLLGSQDIARKYSKQEKNVIAMMHFDMTGHFAGKEQIAIVKDYTDSTLSDFLKKLIEQYSDLSWVESKCGYACSDHASWNKYGFRSAFPIEDPDIESNPNIHSPRDTVDTINFHHVHQFARLALAFAVELSS